MLNGQFSSSILLNRSEPPASAGATRSKRRKRRANSRLHPSQGIPRTCKRYSLTGANDRKGQLPLAGEIFGPHAVACAEISIAELATERFDETNNMGGNALSK